jgi:hypothetical protein
MQPSLSLASSRGKKPVGRTEPDGQEAVINVTAVKDAVDDLVVLYRLSEEATAKLNDGIKATAEKSGLLAATVRKFIVAKASDDFEERRRKVEQLALVFEV